MDRRSYLSAVGVALLAGCLEEPSSAAVEDGGTPVPTDTPTATPTDTPTETPEQLEAQDETPTETETPEPDHDEEQAMSHMDDAQAAIASVVETYRGYESTEADLTDVGPDTQVNHGVAESPITDARDELEEAREHATEEQLATIEDMEAAVDALNEIVRARSYLSDAYGYVSSAVDATMVGDVSAASEQVDALESAVTTAERHVTAAESVDPTVFESTDAFSPEQYDALLSQFGSELASLEPFVSTLPEFVDALGTLLDGLDRYESGSYELAGDHFSDLRDSETFPGFVGSFDGDLVDAYEAPADALACTFEPLDDVARWYNVAAAERERGDDADRYEDRAEDAHDECEHLDLL